MHRAPPAYELDQQAHCFRPIVLACTEGFGEIEDGCYKSPDGRVVQTGAMGFGFAWSSGWTYSFGNCPGFVLCQA